MWAEYRSSQLQAEILMFSYYLAQGCLVGTPLWDGDWRSVQKGRLGLRPFPYGVVHDGALSLSPWVQ